MRVLSKLIVFLFCILSINAQDKPAPILFIYDASGSMWGKLEGSTKKDVAAKVLSTTVSKLPENQNLGLIAYGHRKKSDCDDIEFMVDLTNTSKASITNAVKGMKALGKTPLARSASLAIKSLKEKKIKATVILITDGIESCDGDLCKVIKDARAEGIEFRLHIVGFGLKDGEKDALVCAAKAGDGNYYDAENSADLGSVLTEATKQTVDKPKGNFSVYAVKNGKAVDALVKVKSVITKKEVGLARTYRDTGFVYLEKGNYEVEVKALEASDIPASSFQLELKQGKVFHRDISFDGGYLEVTTTNNGESWDAIVRMLDQTNGKVIANTRTYGSKKQMEVPAGRYNIFVQALNIEGISTEVTIKDVDVIPNSSTPFSYNFQSGIIMIGVQTKSSELIDATVNIFENTNNKNVASGRTYTSSSSNPRKFILNPGTYNVKIMTLGKHKGKSQTFSITVKAGQTEEKIISY